MKILCIPQGIHADIEEEVSVNSRFWQQWQFLWSCFSHVSSKMPGFIAIFNCSATCSAPKMICGVKETFFFPRNIAYLILPTLTTRIISIKKPGRVCLFHWLIYLYHFLKEISEFRTSGKWQKDWDCMNLHCWISRYTVLRILY